MSFDDTIGQGSVGPEGNEAISDNIAVKDAQFGTANSAMSPQSNKTSTRGNERTGNFGGMPSSKPKPNLRNVSNIH